VCRLGDDQNKTCPPTTRHWRVLHAIDPLPPMIQSSALARSLSFFRRFLHSPRHVGALLPSTKHLGKVMVRDLTLAPGDLVVEYGPGTGSLTGAIAEHLAVTSGARYLGIERDESFCTILRHRFPRLAFVHAGAEDVQAVLADAGLPAPRAILSGLPLILLPTMAQIVGTAANVLADGGEFRTFSYLQSYPLPATARLRALMREHFADFRLGLPVLRNFPPAFVLRGHKREAAALAS
jgi:phosphatidylethanolamine/phosphatidyl-N-methylethanolamine N-methyltransferase